jgi:hypothetical protein
MGQELNASHFVAIRDVNAFCFDTLENVQDAIEYSGRIAHERRVLIALELRKAFVYSKVHGMLLNGLVKEASKLVRKKIDDMYIDMDVRDYINTALYKMGKPKVTRGEFMEFMD